MLSQNQTFLGLILTLKVTKARIKRKSQHEMCDLRLYNIHFMGLISTILLYGSVNILFPLPNIYSTERLILLNAQNFLTLLLNISTFHILYSLPHMFFR
jgi:hypothetical protein